MQEKEFDKMIIGHEQAKWMELQKPSVFDNPMYIKDTPKEEVREVIKENEKPVPDYIREAINKFVASERKRGKSERSIRRAVKRKWNITVI